MFPIDFCFVNTQNLLEFYQHHSDLVEIIEHKCTQPYIPVYLTHIFFTNL